VYLFRCLLSLTVNTDVRMILARNLLHVPRPSLYVVAALGAFSLFQVGSTVAKYALWFWKQKRAGRPVSRGLLEVVTALGPVPVPGFGNALYLSRVGFFRALYESCLERQVTVFWLGSTPLLIVSAPDLVEQVLTSRTFEKPQYFGYRSRTVKTALELHQRAELLREKIETADPDQQQRVREDPSRAALLDLIDRSLTEIASSTEKFLAELRAEGNVGKDASKLIQRFYVQLNCKVLFGLVVDNAEATRIASAIEKAGAEFSRRMILPQRALYAWFANVSYIYHTSVLLIFGQKILRHLRISSNSWIHGWLGKAGRLRRLAKVLGLLMAATQTVPIAASWALILVSVHEDVREKLACEARRLLSEDLSVNGGRGVAQQGSETSQTTPLQNANLTASDIATDVNRLSKLLKKHSYFDAVIAETLRLFPPFPLIQRQAQCDTHLGDVFVPGGTLVAAVPWLQHHHPAYWKQAESFNPERWISPTDNVARHGDAPSDYCYIPFGRGRRMCAGNPLAMVELKCLLLLVALQEPDLLFDLEPQETSPEPQAGMRFPPLTMRPPRFAVRQEEPIHRKLCQQNSNEL